MLTLSIDTASDRCAVALWEGGQTGQLLSERERVIGRGHAEALFAIIAEVLEQAAAKPGDIERIAAVRGPGSFTGLRIGLAAARGFALALGVRALAITTFELIAASDLDATGESTPRIVAIDARNRELYVCALGTDLVIAAPPALLSPKSAVDLVAPDRHLVIGPGSEALLLAARECGIEAETRIVARYTAGLLARFAAERDPDHFPPEPLYIRPPDAVLPKSNLRLGSRP